MNIKNKKIVVLGGGTAGWMTALLVRKFYPNYDITIIHDSSIGVLGAGEGTTPNFIARDLELLDITLADIIKHCDATIKNCTEFINWNGYGTKYTLSFEPSSPISYATKATTDILYPLFAYCALENTPSKTSDEIQFNHHLSKVGKVPYVKYPNGAHKPIGAHGVHLNARKLASFLEQKASAAQITIIDGKYVDATQHPDGNIASLKLQDGREVYLDYVFDCSGFARLLLGKLYNTKWISYEEYFPQDTAIPFFLPHNNKNIKPYTESHAMKYGWMWHVNTKDRSGNGYVFDSSLITPEQAIEEVEAYIGTPIDPPTIFKFKAGRYEKYITHNCCAVGLSTGFMEPLEATAIWQSQAWLEFFLMNDGINCSRDKAFLKSTQFMYDQMSSQLLDLVRGHYITPRADTPFWKKMQEDVPMTDTLRDIIEQLRNWQMGGLIAQDNYVGVDTWLMLAIGQKIVDKDVVQSLWNNRQPQPYTAYDTLQQRISEAVKQCYSHDEFLEMMRSK